MSIATELQELTDEFSGLSDGFDRYTYLIELASLLPPPDEEDTLRREEYIYRGCQSQVWLRVRTEQGRVYLDADSDTLLIRGVLVLFREVLNGQPVEEVEGAQFDLLSDLGIGAYFSSARTSGVSGLLPEIKRRRRLCHDLSG